MHRYGFVRAETPPTVHWSLYGTKSHENPRLPTRKGLYLFLKLCYRALHPEVWTMPIWQRIYEESSAAIAAGLRGGVRIGRRLTALDRAKVRAALADPADRDTPLKERAWRWSEK